MSYEAFGVRPGTGPMFADRIDPGPPKSRAMGPVPLLLSFSCSSSCSLSALTVAGLKPFNLTKADPRLGHERRYSGVPPGRGPHVLPDPAINRRAAVICPSGTKNHPKPLITSSLIPPIVLRSRLPRFCCGRPAAWSPAFPENREQRRRTYFL
jgi:hypothetical protein